MDAMKALLAIVGLATAVFVWWAKNDAEKKQKRKDLDDEIDKASSITDFIDIDDKLRNR